jgi:hypothetical protein
MIITLKNKPSFIGNFLSPLSKIDDSCVIRIHKSGATALLAAADNTVILYGMYKGDFGDVDVRLNIPDLKRIIQIISCIEKDSIDLDIDESKIKYTSSDLRFTYHLLDDGILSSPSVSIDKIKNIKYDTNFDVPYISIINLLKSGAFTININKLYLFTQGDSVYAEINDKQSHNVDNICIKLCNKYTGQPIEDPLPLSFDTIRTLAGLRCDKISVRVNLELNVMTFNINIGDVNMMYIISGLVK